LPLTVGARVEIAGRETAADGPALAELLDRAGATVMQATPSTWRLLLDAPGGLGSRRGPLRALVGGEAVPRDLADALAQQTASVWNMYGPTETTIWSTVHRLVGGERVLIGRPIANTRVYVLDEALSPAPIGVPGELYIGGDGLARGYLRRPDLTADRFLPDPFGAEGARMYRTGDLARWLPAGVLECLGRLDAQVKLRGFRIELGEIEVALADHPGVREAVALVREDAPGEKRLVAYVVAADREAPPSVAALRAHLKDRLPEYMVPAAFAQMDALPLTPNGKVDRKALLAQGGAGALAHDVYVAPREPAEEILVRIWQTMLRVERVGVHDNFFALGGDSILSIQLVARATREGIHLTPRQVFQHQTIADLAAVAGKAAAEPEGPTLGDVPLTPIQRWWLEGDPADAHHFNQSVLLEVREPVSAVALEDAVRALIEHHDALRLRASRGEHGWEQQIVPFDGPSDGAAPFQRVDLGDLPDGDRAAAVTAAAERAQASLDLGAGPLLRVVLFTPGPGGHDRLLVVVHHFAVDGVSWRILLDDLWGAYEARRRGEPPALPPRTTSLQRWSRRLADHARSEAVASERAYWLSGARRRVPRLPVDGAGGDSTEGAARNVRVSLAVEETEALLRLVPEVYRTQIDEVLVTALAQALSAWTGSDVVLVDLEGHGRPDLFDDVDLTRTVGWLTVIYPMLVDLGAAADPGAALIRVKEQLRAVPGHGLGHGLLRYVRGDEELAALPGAEVSFNYLGQLDQALPGSAPFSPAREGAGPTRSPRGRRRHALDVVASIGGGRLQARFAHTEATHRRETVEALAEGFAEALRAILTHCANPDVGGPTPSDLLEPGLTDEMIDFMATLDPSAGDD
jgi:non-ribosomal peptide synthase protein (TIGR01720 family)